MDDLIRRLRKWAARWPHEAATAALVAEAADALERLRGELAEATAGRSNLREALAEARKVIAMIQRRESDTDW